MTPPGEALIPVGPATQNGCEICGDRRPPERYMLREMLFGTRESFAYRRCLGCGVLRIVEPPLDMSRHYPPDYYDFGGESGPARPLRRLSTLANDYRDQTFLFGTARWRATLLRRWRRSQPIEVRREAAFVRAVGLRSFDDPILEVGCGRRARNLIHLRRAGFRRLVGIDPFLEHDVDLEGIPLLRRSIHEAAVTLPSRSFRVITLHHSFEHVLDPRETLISVERLLHPGGTVLIRTPVMGTGLWKAYGTAWWELDAPRHLYLHTQASLELLGRDAGLVLAGVTWETSYVEFIASDQIARDIAWREPGSWSVDPPAGFDDTEIETFKERAAALNATGQGGRAAFYFRRG